MLTSVATREVETGGIASVTSFSIQATGKAFKILSDGMYSDKPAAVIRELSCNALDSHVAAGSADTPFEVHLPSEIEPWFSVKDFGTGLSDADVLKLYTTYFQSTKTQSNDFIGALGLGSKSPFSYVDSFTVTSRFNGKRRIYTAFIDAAGIPSIARMNVENTDEPNGLEVSMPVEAKDFRVFMDRARKVLERFSPVPLMTGQQLVIEAPTYTATGDGWRLRDGGLGCYAIQGAVAYPLDASALQRQVPEKPPVPARPGE